MTIPMVALQSVAEVKLGRQRSPKHHAGDQMRPYVRAANVGWDGWLLDDVKSMNFTDSEMDIYRLLPNDLLLGEASGSAREVGKPAIWEGQIADCAFQNTLIRVRPRKADARFLLHYFKYAATSGKFAERARGVGIFHLGRKALAEWQIPLPSSEEQRRIAAVLDAADSLCAKRRQALGKLDNLTRAIFIDMFGDPRMGNGDVGDELGDHVELFSGSTLPAGVEFTGQVDGYALVKVSDLARDANDKFILSTREWTPDRGPAASTCPRGSIVIPKRGGAISTNRKRIATRSSVLDPNLMGVAPNPESLQLEFLYGWFDLLDLESIQSGSSVPQLNKKDLAPLRITVPPKGDQERYGDLVCSIDTSRARMATELVHLEDLFSSLQQRAFRGEL